MENSSSAEQSKEKEVRSADPIDKHSPFIVRGAIIGTGLLGVALFLRNSRLFAKFDRISQIPKEFIQKEIEMKGIVREVLPSGILKVEHVPIVKWPQALSFKKYEPGLLSLRFAGLDIADAGTQFLSKDLRLRDKNILFSVIAKSAGKSETADADVTLRKKPFLHTNLNVDLVRRGYARVPAPDHSNHLRALQTIPAYSRLVSRLLMSEKIADRRGVGVWQRDTWVESFASYPSQISQIIKHAAITRFAVLMYIVGKDMAITGYRLGQQCYYGLSVAGQYLAHLYRCFAATVDKLTIMYKNAKQRLNK